MRRQSPTRVTAAAISRGASGAVRARLLVHRPRLCRVGGVGRGVRRRVVRRTSGRIGGRGRITCGRPGGRPVVSRLWSTREWSARLSVASVGAPAPGV